MHPLPAARSIVRRPARKRDPVLAAGRERRSRSPTVRRMPTPEQIVTFFDPPVPEGHSPWVGGVQPTSEITIADPDPAWPTWYLDLQQRIRDALGARALQVEHVGSTSVPDLPAKPVIDVELIVADPDDEASWLPALESAGFALRVREPWWYGHRMLRSEHPAANVHVFGPDSPEPWRQRIFRDHLRRDAADRVRYGAVKRAAAAEAVARGEHVQQYNLRKEQELRRIYARAFEAAGLPIV
jgi:GrpB-like predicted nucleotidyltransferase (UPF0157 family)